MTFRTPRSAWIGVIGHRQVTDAYLAQLARNHHGRLATLDEGLAAMHDDVAELVPADLRADRIRAAGISNMPTPAG